MTLLLFRDPGGHDRAALAQAVWEEEGDVYAALAPWSADECTALAHAVCASDDRVARLAGEFAPGRFLSTETDPGVDYLVGPVSILVDVDTDDPQVVAAAGNSSLLGATLDALERLAQRERLVVWSPDLEREVDLASDRAELERGYRAECERRAARRRHPLLIVIACVVFAALALLTVFLLKR